MKLYSLQIIGLYDTYNYNVKFNSDVTFIFGTNGCGKTTILNITEAIITGCLYKLFDYDFNKIVLSYTDQDNDYSIIISYDNNNVINTTFMDKSIRLKKLMNYVKIYAMWRKEIIS